MPLLVGAVVFSCEQKELEEITPAGSLNAESSGKAVSANIIYNETFEGSTIWSGLHKQFGTSYAFGTSNSPVFEGPKAGRFELRDSDPITSGGTRAEVLFPEQSNLHRWYGYSVYFPSADYARDSYTEIISQWHQGGGTSPSIALEIKDDRYNVVIPSGASGTGSTQRIDIGAVAKNTWNQFAFHIKHSSGSDGLLEIYLNGKKILSRSGSNMYSLSSASAPRWKVGIYKWKWNDSKTTDTKKRVLFYDNVRIGNEKASLAEMSSGASSSSTTTEPVASTTTEPAPTTSTTTSTSQASSFTLVDASSDKDVMNFGDGATLDLSSLGVRKFNVRANMDKVGSVKFELTGTQNRTYTDNQFPYAVQGDSGDGNYYFGNWEMPTAAGTYTLKVTPYSNSGASGTAGTSTTIRFTVK